MCSSSLRIISRPPPLTLDGDPDYTDPCQVNVVDLSTWNTHPPAGFEPRIANGLSSPCQDLHRAAVDPSRGVQHHPSSPPCLIRRITPTVVARPGVASPHLVAARASSVITSSPLTAGTVASSRSCIMLSSTWPASASSRCPRATKTVRWLDHVAQQAAADAAALSASSNALVPSCALKSYSSAGPLASWLPHLPLQPSSPSAVCRQNFCQGNDARKVHSGHAVENCTAPSSSPPLPPSQQLLQQQQRQDLQLRGEEDSVSSSLRHLQLELFLSPSMLRALEHSQPISSVHTVPRSDGAEPTVLIVPPPEATSRPMGHPSSPESASSSLRYHRQGHGNGIHGGSSRGSLSGSRRDMYGLRENRQAGWDDVSAFWNQEEEELRVRCTVRGTARRASYCNGSSSGVVIGSGSSAAAQRRHSSSTGYGTTGLDDRYRTRLSGYTDSPESAHHNTSLSMQDYVRQWVSGGGGARASQDSSCMAGDDDAEGEEGRRRNGLGKGRSQRRGFDAEEADAEEDDVSDIVDLFAREATTSRAHLSPANNSFWRQERPSHKAEDRAAKYAVTADGSKASSSRGHGRQRGMAGGPSGAHAAASRGQLVRSNNKGNSRDVANVHCKANRAGPRVAAPTRLSGKLALLASKLVSCVSPRSVFDGVRDV